MPPFGLGSPSPLESPKSENPVTEFVPYGKHLSRQAVTGSFGRDSPGRSAGASVHRARLSELAAQLGRDCPSVEELWRLSKQVQDPAR